MTRSNVAKMIEAAGDRAELPPATLTCSGGAWCWQRSHQSQTHGVVRCSSPKVGIGPLGCIAIARNRGTAWRSVRSSEPCA
jgi:hypothetical protein